MNFFNCFLGLIVAFAVWGVSALEQPVSANEQSLTEKALQKKYKGGAEEGDLKVQESLPTALLKVNKAAVQKEVYEEMFAEESEDSKDPKKETEQKSQ